MIFTSPGARAFAFLFSFGLGSAVNDFAKGADAQALTLTNMETNQPALTLARPLGPISTEEAQAALKRIKTPEAGQGTWRKMDVMDDTTSTHTNIVYQWQGPDRKKL